MSTEKNKIKIKWKDVKAKLEEEYENITGDDFTFADSEDENDTIINKLQNKTGKSRAEVEALINQINTTQ